MADKLSDAEIEIKIKDMRFEQRLRQSALKLQSDMKNLGNKINLAFGKEKLANIERTTAAIKNQAKLAAALASRQAAQSRAAGAADAAAIRDKARSMSALAAANARYMQDSARQTGIDRRNYAAASMLRERLAITKQMNAARAASMAQTLRERIAFARQMQQMRGSGAGGGGMSMGGLGMTAAVAAGNLLSAGITRAASAAQDLVTRGFAANAQFDNLNNTFTVMLGSQQKAKNLMADITKLAAKTPFEIGDLSQNTAALLATKQVGERDVLPMLKKLGDAAAGSTEGFASMPRVVRAISQMLSKGKLQAEEMMQLAEAGIPAWSALADKMGISTAKAQELGQKGKLGIKEIMLLVDGLGDKYAGLAAKQSKTFEGLRSTISDNVTIALAKATRPIYDRITGIMAKMVEVMDSPAFQGMIDSVTDKISLAIKWLDKMIDRAIEFATSPVGKAAIQFAAIAASVATAVIGMTALSAATAFAAPFAGTIAIIAAKIALISAGIAAFSMLLRNAFSGPMGAQFTAQLAEIWRLLREIGGNVGGAVLSVMRQIGDAIAGVFGQTGGIQQGFNAALSAILGGLKRILDFAALISADFGNAWEIVKATASDAVMAVVDKLMSIGSEVLAAWESIKATIEYYTGISVDGIYDGIVDSFSSAIDWVKNAWAGLVEYMSYLLQDAGVSDFADNMKETVQFLKGMAKKAPSAIAKGQDEIAKQILRVGLAEGRAQEKAVKPEAQKDIRADLVFPKFFSRLFIGSDLNQIDKQEKELNKQLAENARKRGEKFDPGGGVINEGIKSIAEQRAAKNKEIADRNAQIENDRKKRAEDRTAAAAARDAEIKSMWQQQEKARADAQQKQERRDILGKFVKTFRIDEIGAMAAKIDPQKLPAQIGAMAGGLMNQIFGFIGGAAIGGAPAAAAAEKKNRKAEFVGLAEMNKRIQGMLGENEDKKIAKQQLGAAKAGAAAAQHGAKAGQMLVNGVKDLIGAVKNINTGFGT